MYYVDNGGLYFSCKRCSVCCRFDSGQVYLTSGDIQALAVSTGMKQDEFVLTYCRRVWAHDGRERISLRERETSSGFDCVFWKDGCSVYEARPVQCKTYPFWTELVSSRNAWEENARSCPGANCGKHWSVSEITALLNN